MALQHMSAIHTPPSAIVICSDSKAALSSIGSVSANAREDVVREIVTIGPPPAGTESSSLGCRHILHASCTGYTWTGGWSCAYPHPVCAVSQYRFIMCYPSLIIVQFMSNIFLLQQIFVATNNFCFCYDKHVFVATKHVSQNFCRDKNYTCGSSRQ